MSYTLPDPTDDPEFLAWVEAVLVGVDRARSTEHTYVVKIDKWFSRRWLGFSGKALGAISVHQKWLTIPPFVPSRIRSVRRFSEPGPNRKIRPRLHRWQPSSRNLQRHVEKIVLSDSNLFWFSGGTQTSDRGCLMAYIATPDGHWPWYVGVHRSGQWQVGECVGIGPREVEVFREGGLTSA